MWWRGTLSISFRICSVVIITFLCLGSSEPLRKAYSILIAESTLLITFFQLFFLRGAGLIVEEVFLHASQLASGRALRLFGSLFEFCCDVVVSTDFALVDT